MRCARLWKNHPEGVIGSGGQGPRFPLPGLKGFLPKQDLYGLSFSVFLQRSLRQGLQGGQGIW